MQISYLNRVTLLLVSLASALIPSHLMAEESKKPNVLVVVLDDVGYSDLGSFGSNIDTPNIDSVASDGIKYTNFHSSPTCSPSRASLLTGREPHRVGMGLVSRFDFGPRFPAFRGRITDEAATMAQVLSEQNYVTYGVGKWHLLPPSHMKPTGPFDHWPSGKGFQRYYGFLAGSTDQFQPELFQDNHFIDREYEDGYYLPRDMTNKAINMLHNHVSYSPERPFLMYYSAPGMHAPHQAEPEFIEKYKGQFDQGWDIAAESRLAKQKQLGIIPKNTQLAPRDDKVKLWDSLEPNAKAGYSKLQEVYAGFLDQTDHELGRLFAEMKKLSVYEDTIIVIVSDNGGSQEGNQHGSVNHSSNYSGAFETAQDVYSRITEIGSATTAANYPLGWSRVSNTPFKYFKQDTYSGGINVPFIIKLPGNSHQGELRHQYHYISDVMPTIFDYLDLEIPDEFNGIDQLPVDGISMKYSIDDESAKDQRITQFYRMGFNRGIYHKGWSAVARHKEGDDFDDDKWELFNLTTDISQSKDLSTQYPDKLEELQELWEEEGEKVNADLMIDPRNPGALLGSFLKIRKAFSNKPKKQVHKYYPKASYVAEKSAPKVTNRSFEIAAKLNDKVQQGVIFTYGNADSGLVLYVDKGKLIYEYNYLENVPSLGKRYRVISDASLEIEPNLVEFKFTKTGDFVGTGQLFINDKPVSEKVEIKTLKGRLSHEGAGIGKNWFVPVTPGSDKFPTISDKIDWVEVTVYNNK